MSPPKLKIYYYESNVMLIFHKPVCLWGCSSHNHVVVGFTLQLPEEPMPITTSTQVKPCTQYNIMS